MATNSQKPLALVTGASKGIGYELARVFAEHGHDLVIAAEDGGIVEARQAFEALGVAVTSVQVDLTRPEGVEELLQRVRALGRPLDCVAINAGVGVGGPFHETELRKNLEVVDLNCRSVVHLAHHVVRDMVARGEGRILITSSIASTMPGPFEAVYAASKAFDQSFAQALRNELKDTGVTVTSLMPGPTETDFFRRAGLEDTKVGAGEKDDAGLVAKQGYEALMAGKDHVVAGSVKNKLQAAAAKIIPETVKAQIHRSKAEPGSANK
jgi:short-subunit dehydrogenase